MNCMVLRIGVFFDGTGNNLVNDIKGKKESNVAKLYRLYCSSYEGGDPSHAPVLFGHNASECRIVTKAIYIEGLGTVSGGDDEITGLGMGSGGAIRIQRAINQIEQLREIFPEQKYKCYIDVFGFSRGSALAREFINQMHAGEKDNGYKQRLSFSFKFVGLFDTVASFGRAGDDKDYKPVAKGNSEGWSFWYDWFSKIGITPSDQKYVPYNFNLSPQSAERIVHLIALDEYRENFPLTNTEGVGETYELIGAHSDVGGGYEPSLTEHLFEYHRHLDSKTALKRLEQPENGIVIGKGWKTEFVSYQEVYPAKEHQRDLLKCNGYREVSNDLQDVGLLLMYNLAVQSGVPLLPFEFNLTESRIKTLQKEILYSKHQPITQTLHRHSASLKDKLGDNSSWSQELKEYCIQAIENPTELASYLNQYTPIIHWKEKKQAEPPIRSLNHLKILAQYAHNSACSVETYGFNFPPFGFKHRRFAEFNERISNKANYRDELLEKEYPLRLVFNNNPELANKK